MDFFTDNLFGRMRERFCGSLSMATPRDKVAWELALLYFNRMVTPRDRVAR
jgi:hypothetical protein